MDLEWLLPEQIEQILKLCELSSMDDPSVAANILETNHWNLEEALHHVVKQNDQISLNDQRKQQSAAAPTRRVYSHSYGYEQNYDSSEWNESSQELGSHQYHQLDNPITPTSIPPIAARQQASTKPQINSKKPHTHLLAEQNREYLQVQKHYNRKKQEESEWNLYSTQKQSQISEGRKQFQNSNEIKQDQKLQIKFRLPHNGQVQLFVFNKEDKIERVFKYVSSYFRDMFEDRYGDFDLTQAFPQLSLSSKQNQALEQVFGDSNGEVLIIKEL